MTSDLGPQGVQSVTLVHEGVARSYVLHLPPRLPDEGTRRGVSLRPAAAGMVPPETTVPADVVPAGGTAEPFAPEGLPLVLGLHGRGIDAAWFDRLTGFSALARQAGFVLALPNAVEQRWNDGRDPARDPLGPPHDTAYLAAVIDDIRGRLAIDPRRIYVVGLSNGATMAGRLACEMAQRIAGVAQVAGTAAVEVAAACRPGLPVPILNIHGSADPHAPYAGGVRRSLRGRLLLRPAGRPMVGVDAWARFWVAANGCREVPELTAPAPHTTVRAWRGLTPASDVVFYRAEGGGHTWPGGQPALPRLLFGPTSQEFSATSVAWQFLASHRR